MKTPTFNFESVNKVIIKRKVTRRQGFSVNFKHGYIHFPISYIEDNKLDGKMLKWFVDVGKKAIGWKILDNDNRELLCNLKEYIIVKKTSNQYNFSIQRILHSFQFKDNAQVFKCLEVKKHVDQQEGFYGGIIHYLILDMLTHDKATK